MNSLSAWLELLALPGVFLGAAFCFYGYRIHRFLVSAGGYITGAAIGIAVGFFGGFGLGPVGGIVLGAILALVLGPIGAATARIREVTSTFLLGAVVGGGAGIALGAGSGSIQAALPLAVFLALFGGWIAVVIRRLLIMVSTAYCGAALLVASAWMLAGGLSPELIASMVRPGRISSATITADLGGTILVFMFVGGAGAIYQLRGGKSEREASARDASPRAGAHSRTLRRAEA